MAICGTGMGSLAGLLHQKGYDVCGSDGNVYPPMSVELKKLGLRLHTPFAADNIRNEKPDLIIVGNAISKSNPEAAHLLETGIPYVSMPQALKYFFLRDKDVIVVSGTHGKTTTSSLMAHLLAKLGQDPSFMIGGVTRNFSTNFHIGQGRYFVIEGDEYDTAFFDKGPKFLHYNPRHVIMTSLEFDHADIYRDLAHVTQSFVALAKIIPAEGSLHYCDGYPALEEVIPHCQAGMIRPYGAGSPKWQIDAFTSHEGGVTFDILADGKKVIGVQSPLSGFYNAQNAAACFSVLETIGLDLQKAARHLPDFLGVKRRQETLFQDSHLAVIDDFAHHPTAVSETITAIRQKFPDRRLIAVFEPRSNSSKRDIFQNDYVKSFLRADESILARVFMAEKVTDGKILNVGQIVADLNVLGKTACHYDSTAQIIDHILKGITRPTAVLIMSNGHFDNLSQKLIDAYGANAAR